MRRFSIELRPARSVRSTNRTPTSSISQLKGCYIASAMNAIAKLKITPLNGASSRNDLDNCAVGHRIRPSLHPSPLLLSPALSDRQEAAGEIHPSVPRGKETGLSNG